MIKDIAVLSPLYITVFWGIVFLADYSKSKPKFLLGIFMFVSFLLYLTHTFFFTENYLACFHTESIYVLTSLTVFPLYYCYIKLLTVENSFKIKNLIHFIPAVLLGLASFITGLFFTNQQRLEYIDLFVMRKDTSGSGIFSPAGIKSGIFIICRIVFVIQVFYYLLNGVILTQQHERRIANFYSNADGKSLFRVKMVTLSFLITSVMSITFAIIGRNLFLINQQLLIIPSIIFSSLLYLIGYLGNITKQVIVESRHNYLRPNSSRIHNTELMREKILHLFKEDKIFKNSDLLLTNLSETLHAPGDDVSQLINEEFRTDFSDFVNHYRISVAKELIDNDINNGRTFKSIASESGFDSLSSFTRVFKSYEGVSPQKYWMISTQREYPK